jgi:hypothetical protein
MDKKMWYVYAMEYIQIERRMKLCHLGKMDGIGESLY